MSVDLSGVVTPTKGYSAVDNSGFWNSTSSGFLVNGLDMKNNRLYPTGDITICNVSGQTSNNYVIRFFIKTPYATGTFPNLNLFTSVFFDQPTTTQDPEFFVQPELISFDISLVSTSGNINTYQGMLVIDSGAILPADSYVYILSLYGSCYRSSYSNDIVTSAQIKGTSTTPNCSLNYNIPTNSNIKGDVSDLGEIYPVIEQIKHTVQITPSFTNGSYHGATLTLQRNFRNTTNYMPFVSVISNDTAESYANNLSADNISKPIIYNRTSTSFSYSYKFTTSNLTRSVDFYFMIVYY